MIKAIVHCKEQKYDELIGRPSIWGNPFIIGVHGNRDEVINQYEFYIRARPDLLKKLPLLNDKILGCWCKTKKNPNTACHGDVLVKLLKEIEDGVLVVENT